MAADLFVVPTLTFRLLFVLVILAHNAYVERVIGSIRRECLDHVIVLNEAGLRRLLARYVAYYTRSRTHLGWPRTARWLGPFNHRYRDASSRPRKSAACTSATTASPRNEPGSFRRADLPRLLALATSLIRSARRVTTKRSSYAIFPIVCASPRAHGGQLHHPHRRWGTFSPTQRPNRLVK